MENNTPETNNFLNWVEIKNFKSIKDLRLDCKRVNVFIGKPNVGKSNILEGLGLLGGSYDNEYLNNSTRYKQVRDIFFDHDVKKEIEVSTDSTHLVLNKNEYLSRDGNEYWLNWESKGLLQKYLTLNESGKTTGIGTGVTYTEYPDGIDGRNSMDVKFRDIDAVLGPVKKYNFADKADVGNSFQDFLLPPDGYNMYSIIRANKELWAEIFKLFAEQQLEFVLNDEKQEFLLQKKNGPFIVQYPFFSIADTFRRYMFYITAIESNKNSVIVFEEPEVHSFPPYVKAMAHRMVSSDTNQFFVSTHSPYLLQTLISELDESELAVYITYYEDYQTHVRQLTADELQEAQDLGIDLFYNLSRYEPNA